VDGLEVESGDVPVVYTDGISELWENRFAPAQPDTNAREIFCAQFLKRLTCLPMVLPSTTI
jgi:serine phosphatase RsbU (regulator of sigma subunit)